MSSSAFWDVDASGRSEELAAYLAFVAERLAPIRRQGRRGSSLEARHDDGTFFASAVLYSVTGRSTRGMTEVTGTRRARP